MKSIQTSLIAAGLLATLSGMSLAQNSVPADSSRIGPVQKIHAQHADQHTKHLSELQSKLNLSNAQDSAWQSFTQSMQGSAHPMRPDRAAFEKMTTPERIDQMQAMKAQRDAVMQRHAEATKTFYAQLNAEQKKVFDAQTMGFMQGMRSGMHHMKGHHDQH